MVVKLSNTNSGLLPPTVVGPIFDQAIETSSVMSLARRVPLSITANTVVPVSMDIPAAGWVAEGAAKPVGAAAIGIKQMSGKKVALLVPVSEEVATTNPGGLYSQLQQDLPVAIARAFDYAAIHGLDLRTGGAGPFPDYLRKNAASIELGTATQANGGMYADLVGGEAAVADAGYDFSGFAADPRLKPTLKLRTDTTGRPLFVDSVDSGFGSGSLIGYPAFYNRGVSGSYRRSGSRVQTITVNGSPTGGTFTLSYGGQTTGTIAYNAAGATVQTAIRALGGSLSSATVSGAGPYTVTIGVVGSAAAPFQAQSQLTGGTNPGVSIAQSPDSDSNVRAIGGDWSQCAYGVGQSIRIKVSTEASFVDLDGSTVSAFQNNLVLLLVEAYFGFVTSDALGAFVTYVDAV